VSSLLEFYTILLKSQPKDVNKIFTENITVECKFDSDKKITNWEFANNHIKNQDIGQNTTINQPIEDLIASSPIDKKEENSMNGKIENNQKPELSIMDENLNKDNVESDSNDTKTCQIS